MNDATTPRRRRTATAPAARMLTLAEAAAELGLSATTLRHQAGSGVLRATLYGKTWLVPEAEVARYRAEHMGRRGRPAAS